MPCSCITTLRLEGCSPAPTRHILTLLGSSLTTLRFNKWIVEAYEIRLSTPLPRLTFFENPVITNVPSYDYFALFQNIRVLIFILRIREESNPFPPTALPHLTYLYAPTTTGMALIPGRPVRTYRMHSTYLLRDIEGLMKLAPGAQHVKELQLELEGYPWRLAKFFAFYFPNLVRVHLMIRNVFDLPEDGELEPPPPQGDVHLSLKEFDIGFYPPTEFPHDECRQALTRLTKVYPALEVVRFGALFLVDGGGIKEANIPLNSVMDMRRTSEGEWKERK